MRRDAKRRREIHQTPQSVPIRIVFTSSGKERQTISSWMGQPGGLQRSLRPPASRVEVKAVMRVAVLAALWHCSHKFREASFLVDFDHGAPNALLEGYGLSGQAWEHLYYRGFRYRKKSSVTSRLSSRHAEARVGAWMGQRLAGWTWSEIAKRAGRDGEEHNIKRGCLEWAGALSVDVDRLEQPC